LAPLVSNKQNKKFSLKDRIKSFKFAFNGLYLVWKYEHNFRIHFFLAILACLFSYLFACDRFEILIIFLNIGIVFTAELFNTSIEYLSDEVNKEFSLNIKYAKDISAASVFVSSIFALISGIIIFVPKILK
jgi:diacylglycerol kinase